MNIPYDIRSMAYGSYPEFAPTKGYFIGMLRRAEETIEICDIVTEDGLIISGEFREKSDISETFPDVKTWIHARTCEAIEIMKAEGLLSF